MSTANELCLALQPSWLFALLLAWQQRAERRARELDARHTMRALQRLDARTLHDIGLDASERSSVALEAAGCIEATRWRNWT